MSTAEMIKQARERLGMTQESLAERLEVSRQAVSKWELGTSVPSPENLALLEEVLDIQFPAPEADFEEGVSGTEPKTPFWNWKRVVLLVLGVLVLLALLSSVMFMAFASRGRTDAPAPGDPRITDIAFFDGNAAPLRPDLGDGWNSFAVGERVLMVVEFANGTENSVNAVSLFLTPTGTETFDLREQIAVQAVADGRSFALFAWDVPQSLMGHLEVVLECGGGLRITETLNVAASSSILGGEGSTDLDDPDLVYPPEGEISPEPDVLTLNTDEILAVAGETGHFVLEAYGAPFAEVEWTSSNPDVARVANTGRVFIEGAGEAAVTASWNGQTAKCMVHVADQPEPAGVPGVSSIRP